MATKGSQHFLNSRFFHQTRISVFQYKWNSSLQCFFPSFQKIIIINFLQVFWIEDLGYILGFLFFCRVSLIFSTFVSFLKYMEPIFLYQLQPNSAELSHISAVAVCMLQHTIISYLTTAVNSVQDTWISSIISITLHVPFWCCLVYVTLFHI